MPTWNEILVWGVPIVVGVVGVAWLAWALFSDRARGRLRCPRCWYDMSGVDASDGAVCPECGRGVKRAKGLRRTRRRWRHTFVAAVLVVVAYPAHVALLASQVGWAKALPSSVLVFVAPMEDPAMWVASKPTDPMFVELLRRGQARELAVWQWRVLFRRLEHEAPRALAWDEVVQTRPVWARDSEAVAWIRNGASPIAFVLGLGDPDIALHARIVGSEHPGGVEAGWWPWDPASIGTPRGDAGRLELRVLWIPNAESFESEAERFLSAEAVTLWRGEVASFDVVESATEILEPWESAAMDAWFTDMHGPGLHVGPSGRLYFHDLFGVWGHYQDDPGAAVGAIVCVMRDDALVAVGDLILPVSGYSPDDNRPAIAPLDWIYWPRPLDLEDASWRIRVTGRASIALRQLRVNGWSRVVPRPPHPTHYWSGEVEMDARLSQPFWEDLP